MEIESPFTVAFDQHQEQKCNNMKILDIDMDYFQSEIHYNAHDNMRHLINPNIVAWEKDRFFKFLVDRCALSKDCKVYGRIINYHKDAYGFFEELIKYRNLEIPCDITHVDAHSDMGYALDPEYYNFITSINCVDNEFLDKEKLFSPSKNHKYINSGNYINALVLNKWVRNVEYVYHERMGRELDVIQEWFSVIAPTKLFQFKFNCDPGYFKSYLIPLTASKFVSDTPFDYIIVAKSPSYTVKGTDELVNIIKEFIIEI